MTNSSSSMPDNPTIYDFKIKALNSKGIIDFEAFRGKKILLVNVASRCGYTYQYEGLEELYQAYKDQLVIIGFPCNQFLRQEPGDEAKIAQFCAVNYGVTFPMTEKIKVKGRDAHDIYKWLSDEDLNGQEGLKITWNFNKILIDENGEILYQFGASVKPMDKEIIQHLT